MKKRQKPTRPRPIKPKKIRERKTDWDYLEMWELIYDRKERERKLKGPSEKAKKLLAKKPKDGKRR